MPSRSGKKSIAGRRNLPLMLLAAREILLQRFRPVFQQFGLTEQQWRVLRLVSDEGRIEQHRIAHLCQFSGPNLSIMLARLEELAYVQRDRSDEDHRRVFVSLGPKGRALVTRIAPHIDRCYRELDLAIGEELMQSLIRVLDRLMSVGGNTRGGSKSRPSQRLRR